VAVLRSIVRSIKAVLYFAWFGLELIVRRPKSRRGRARWLHRLCAALLRGFDVKLTIEGEFPKQGVLISNHTGYLDIAVYAAMSMAVYCAKAEMESWPVLGWMATMAGTVFIDRGAGGSAERAKAGMRAAEEDRIPVIFFPEGTTSNGEQVLPFRSGLLAVSLEADQPITAAYIRYTLDEDNGPGVTVQANVAFWGDDVKMLDHIFKFFQLKGVHAWVKIAPEPIRFSSPDIDRKQAAREARQAVLTLAGLEDTLPAVAEEVPALNER
jgi:1-acyl-sn-glycerol-3-phosphate acyltransferase